MNGIPSIQIQSAPARLELPKLKGELSVDQYPSRASYNIQTIPDLMRTAAQSGRQTAMETIGRIASDGDAVANRQATAAALLVASAEPAPAVVDLVSIERPALQYQVNRQPGNYEPGSIDVRI